MKDIKVNEYWIKMYVQVETAVEDFAVLFDFCRSHTEKGSSVWPITATEPAVSRQQAIRNDRRIGM